jgi:hypothetical protein
MQKYQEQVFQRERDILLKKKKLRQLDKDK